MGIEINKGRPRCDLKWKSLRPGILYEGSDGHYYVLPHECRVGGTILMFAINGEVYVRNINDYDGQFRWRRGDDSITLS